MKYHELEGTHKFQGETKGVSSFICLFLVLVECSHSLCQALGLSWVSAEPSQFSDLIRVLPQTFSAGLSSSLLGHIFQNQCVCSISPACLIQQLPDLQQGIPAVLAAVAWLLLWCQCQNWSSPSLWFPASAAALWSRHNCVCSHRANRIRAWIHQMAGRHQTATLGCWQGQGTGRTEQLGDTAGLTQLRWHCWVWNHSSQQFSYLWL